MPLHAAWFQSHLHLWSDDGDPSPNTPGTGARPHPRALTVERLRAMIGELAAESLLASAAGESSLVLDLPTNDAGEPIRSGPFTQVSPFTIPTLRLSPTEAVDLLVSPTQPTADCCGDSYRYFSRLATFVTERLAKQQFFPDLAATEEGARANWRLLMLGEEELHRLEQFGLAMPPAARAFHGIAGEDIDPAHIVESFLATTADAIIRRDVSTDEFFSRAHEKAAEPEAPGELRWLSALLGSDPQVRGSDVLENNFLVDQVRSWIGKLDESTAAAPLRICFVLEEPEDDSPEDATLIEAALASESADAAANGETITDPSAEIAPAPANQPLWQIRVQLQSLEPDGETTDAAELWKQRHDLPGVLGRNLANRRAHLLSELQRASEIFPALQRVLTTPEPAQLEISTIEAHLFIRQYATVLRENAFGVTLPDWATRRDRELGLVLALAPNEAERDDDVLDESAMVGPDQQARAGQFPDVSTGKFGLDSLLDFDWQIAVGDLRLSMEDFKYLVKQNSPLARYKGQWLTIDLEAAKRAVEFLSKKPKGKMTLAEAFRTAYAQKTPEAGLPVLALTGTSWVQDLLEHAPNAKLQEVPPPPNFLGTLRPYQHRGLEWLSFLHRLGIGACLADDMGLGKTVQLIALLLHERRDIKAENTASLGPTLLFAPTSVVGNWTRELERFAPSLKVLIHHGPERLAGDTFVTAAGKHDIVITSYALAHRDLDDIQRVPWRRLALDEAQKIKNPAAASSIAIRSLAAPHRVALTGTPIENHLSELWSIMELLNPGLLGTAADFRERFSVPIEKLQDQSRAQQLRKMIQPFILRRTKADPTIAGDLPEKMEMKVYCNLTPEQASVYQKITSEMLSQIDAATGIRRRGLILAALTRLKQVCDHPALLSKIAPEPRDPLTEILSGRSGKCERLIEMLEEVIEAGDAALIFTQYREMGHLLERVIAERLKAPTLFLHGGTPAKRRDEMITQFQEGANGVKLFILSLRAGGLGLNLTAANHVFHFDRWWNPAVEAQATDRAYRIGQTRKVQVHKFICVGTMEERIDKLLTDKIALADQIVRAGDEWLTNLSTSELKDYLSLSSEAVGEY
ncbi:MAG TPA: DEAD/DEAH box helicase [Tepidisphaeraceae bacterium]|jgi:SNF2 family DNA or RNA helicase|nr:DEAD/DEAH box helicase [Tepidisphaeraceae bacterium]